MLISRNFRSLFFKKSVFKNSFSTSSAVFSADKRSVEIRVPCPWGHISGVWWGREDVQPILAVHGWLDNSQSWKRLAEHLVDDRTSLLAIDLPGTGYSSHLPPFYNYHFSASASVLRRVQLHYKFKDLVIFGHSGGSASAFLFAALYPDVVKAYLGVDYIFYAYKNDKQRAEATGEVLKEFLALSLKASGSRKKYSWNDAKNAWIQGSLLGASNPELVEDLMERGMNKVGDQYEFSRDLRLKHLKAVASDCFSIDQTAALAKSVSCHVCFIKSLDSTFFEMGIRNFPSMPDILRESSKSFQLHEINGHHHVHMEHPEKVAEIASSFLKSIS